jgi:flavodoxin
MKGSRIDIVLLAVVLIIFSSCSRARNIAPEMKAMSNNNVLIVYLSRTKNTKTVAEIIKENTDGFIVELELKNPYPKDYQANVDQVVKENETGFLPLLKTNIDSIAKYDFVFVGFPTWDMKIPPPLKSFLKQYDLAGKTIIPFNTNAGYGVGRSFQTLKELCPPGKVLKGYETHGGKEKEGVLLIIEGERKTQVEKEIKQWLREIKIIK